MLYFPPARMAWLSCAAPASDGAIWESLYAFFLFSRESRPGPKRTSSHREEAPWREAHQLVKCIPLHSRAHDVLGPQLHDRPRQPGHDEATA
jgi:hypothetical protein